MTTWFERRAGSEESLLALYDAVEATEEIDLTEQARTDALRAEPADEPVQADIDTVDVEDDTTRMTMSQAVGIVEHLLGGQSMP